MLPPYRLKFLSALIRRPHSALGLDEKAAVAQRSENADAVVGAAVTLDLLPSLAFVAGQIRFVSVAGRAVEYVNDVVVLLGTETHRPVCWLILTPSGGLGLGGELLLPHQDMRFEDSGNMDNVVL